MAVLPFRKPSAAAPVPPVARTVAEQVCAMPGKLAELDRSEVYRLEGAPPIDGSAQVTYSAKLEVSVRQMVARFGMPRMPLTAAEFEALTAYAAFLESARADNLEHAQTWRASMLAQAEKHHPGYAPGLRLFLAENLPGLVEHHRTACGYPELIRYADDYY